MSYKDYQARLLNKISKISEKTREAYCKTPRHLFVKRFSVDGERWISLNYENMKSHLPLIYSDHPLLLFDNGAQISTISQPSLVLRMLDLLDVMEGHKVFELGTGSGWNAALLGQLVGKEGLVMSFEIIDEMAAPLRRILPISTYPRLRYSPLMGPWAMKTRHPMIGESLPLAQMIFHASFLIKLKKVENFYSYFTLPLKVTSSSFSERKAITLKKRRECAVNLFQ